jgi:hypothetical protein
MTDTMTSQNIDLSSWDILYIWEGEMVVSVIHTREISCYSVSTLYYSELKSSVQHDSESHAPACLSLISYITPKEFFSFIL